MRFSTFLPFMTFLSIMGCASDDLINQGFVQSTRGQSTVSIGSEILQPSKVTAHTPVSQDSLVVATGKSVKPLKLLEHHVTLHALSKLQNEKTCSPVYAMELTSRAPYRDVMIHLRNRAFTSGANAVAVTHWNEGRRGTSLTAHMFDCSSLKGSTCKKGICKHKPS